MQEKIDKYYKNLGVNVRFNTLGYDEDLIHSYVNDFNKLVINSKRQRSNHIKLDCYNTFFSHKSRNKLTGFESLKTQDEEFRQFIRQHIKESQFTPTLTINDKTKKDISENYLYYLKNSLKDLDNIILYLSGGLDSEFLGNVLLSMNKNFTPVIFVWKDSSNKILNFIDIKYAYQFCNKNNLKPVSIDLDLETLWKSDEFINLAKDIQISSTQQVTYAYCVKLVNELHPDSTHLFGGEVRFFSTVENNERANIVFLAKVCPPGYNTNSYQGQVLTGGGSCTLEYFNSTGEWRVARTGFGSITGIWTTTPASLYEYLIDAVDDLGGVGLGQIIPNTPMTSWAPIDGFPTQICRVQIPNPSSSRDANFEIWVRSVSDPSNICISTIRLVIEGIS